MHEHLAHASPRGKARIRKIVPREVVEKVFRINVSWVAGRTVVPLSRIRSVHVQFRNCVGFFSGVALARTDIAKMGNRPSAVR